MSGVCVCALYTVCICMETSTNAVIFRWLTSCKCCCTQISQRWLPGLHLCSLNMQLKHLSLSPMLWFSLGAWIGLCWIFVIKKAVTWVSACNKCVRRRTDWPSFTLSYLGFRVPATHYWYLERKEKKAKVTQKSPLTFYSQKEKNLENTYNYLVCNLILTAHQS